jgi:hypothetical protein
MSTGLLMISMRQAITSDLVQQYTQIARGEQPESIACRHGGGSPEKIVLDDRDSAESPSPTRASASLLGPSLTHGTETASIAALGEVENRQHGVFS